LADLDGDETLEIIVTSDNRNIWAWHYQDADGLLGPDRVENWPQTLPFPARPLGGSSVVADIDGDGRPEILQGGGVENPRLYAWHADGTQVVGWPMNLGAAVLETPSVGSVDGRGAVQLFIGNDLGTGADGFAVYGFELPSPFDPNVSWWPTYLRDAQRTGNAKLTSAARVNEPPQFDPLLPTSVSVATEESVAFLVVATDPDPNFGTLSASDLPEGAVFTLLGDLDSDGSFTQADLLLLTDFVLGVQTPTPNQRILGDLDGDGSLNVADIVRLVNVLLRNLRVGRFSWTPTASQERATPYNVTFTAIDAGTPELSASAVVAVSVSVPTASLTGLIRLSDGRPLPCVQVRVKGNSIIKERIKRTVLTDANGLYTIPALPSGTYKITPVLRGYAFSPSRLSGFVWDARSPQPPGLCTGAPTFASELPQPGTGRVIGMVTYSSGQPLTGATLKLKGGWGSIWGTLDLTLPSGSDGRVVFDAMPAGAYTISIKRRRTHFEPKKQDLELSEGEWIQFDFPALP
jgi:hypothetical protein